MLKRVKANKNKSLASGILENMTMTVTLSDRLRRAGIRECEPNYETKTGNLGQNRKSKPKKGLAESCNERNKLQNLCNEFYSPYFKDCYQNKTSREKTQSKNYSSFSKSLRRKIKCSAKKTVFASLDFIKDCQKYKKKITNLEKNSELKTVGKSESVFNNHTQSHSNHSNLYTTDESQNLQISKTYSQIPFCEKVNKKEEEAFIYDVWDEKEVENSRVKKDSSFTHQNTKDVNMKEESTKDEKKVQSNKKISETLSHAKPFFDEFPSGDVARIDRKYLESLLSITNANAKKYTDEDESKNNEEAAGEKHSQEKEKKKSNKIISENKTRIKKSEERRRTVEKVEKNSESIQIPCNKESVLAKIIRDSTKSEAQIFVQKKYISQRNTEMKSEKNMAHKKPEVNDIRKNRKNRNKLLKSKSRELSSSVYSNEISKAVDLKELWRRDLRGKSENSLSSNSSCTVHKSDADSEQKNLNLESYKFLKKFVEEEDKKASNESEKKSNLKEIESTEYNFKTNEFILVNLKESEKMENICKKLKISLAENVNDKVEIIKNEMGSLKKKLAQAKHPQHYSIYEGEKINSTLLSALAEDKLKNSRGSKKLFKENEKSIEKVPSQIVNNWSILNRLEQAFLALGTPNFPNRNKKNSKSSKGEELISNKEIGAAASNKSQNHLEKVSKKPRKTKEVERKKSTTDASNTINSTSKAASQNIQNKKFENDEQQSLIKYNQQKNKLQKEPKSDAVVEIAEDKKTDTIQEEKKISDLTTHEKSNKTKPILKSQLKPKLNVHEPRQSESKQDKKSPSRSQTKKSESFQKKLPKVLKKNKNSEENLEKKKTFAVIQKKDFSTVQARKSKSCDKTDNFKQNDVKIHFSQTNNQKSKKNNILHKNINNEADSKPKSFTPKKFGKIPVRTKSETHGKCKTTEVESLKEPQKSSVKILEDKIDQEKPCENEKEKETQELPTQIQEEKLVNNPSEKVIKERSILSISGKQQILQESTKKLMQIEGKDASDIYFCPHVSGTENSESEKSQSDSHDFLIPPQQTEQRNNSTFSNLNVSNFKLTDSNSTKNQKEFDVNSQESSRFELSKNLTPLSNFSNNNSTSTQVSEVETDKSEPNFPECPTMMLWERDIRHYHALVKEIMSHYDRIDGFLTHSDYLQSFSTDSADQLSLKNNTDKNSMSDVPLKMNYREYRKKIMSEYQALPIFEYKRLIQEKKEGNLLTKGAKKRNLAVVKDVTAEMDLDVKDFQPKIQKVLDSQFYVDVENMVKRNYPKVKLKEKKSSLQEIILSKNVRMANQENLRTSSMIKAFSLMPSASVCVDSSQKLKTVGSFLEDSTETITSTSIEETESENL